MSNEEHRTDEEMNEKDYDEGEEIKVDYENQERETEEVESRQGNAEIDEEAVSEIDQLKRELEDKNDKYMRLAAEFENYKKRTAREFGNLVETANRGLITSLLEILDNFQRAMSSESSSDIEAFQKGMELIYNQFQNLLKEQGLEEIHAEGKEFDPELHDAVMAVQTDEVPEDHVVEEFQKGYKLKGRVIRHSKVSVAKPASA